jgi:hypothetical protein
MATRTRKKGRSKKAAPAAGKAGSVRRFEDLLAGASPRAAGTARRLRAVVREILPGYEENIYGGAKTSIALFSHGGPNRVLCGIQASGEDCLFYVHHAFHLSHPEIKFDGKGKHARHIRYASAADVKREPLACLLREAQRKSGYK